LLLQTGVAHLIQLLLQLLHRQICVLLQ
jgi:hypothetical protein